MVEENARIDDIFLFFDEWSGQVELRVYLSCNVCFQIRTLDLTKFTKQFVRLFDELPTKLESTKGRYVRAIFDDKEKLIGLKHIVKGDMFYLEEFK